MDKPAEEQLEKFWDWCGWTYLPNQADKQGRKINDACWLEPGQTKQVVKNSGNMWHFSVPKIDLNNLFKYAVPTIEKKGYHINIHLYAGEIEGQWGKCAWVEIKKDEKLMSCFALAELEDALFWAIWEVINGQG
jgi:hypothetical protein